MVSKRELASETKALLRKARSVSGIRPPAERYGLRSSTVHETFRLLRRGLSPRMIAEKRDLEESTVADHLMALADRGVDFDLSRHLDVCLLEELRDKAAGWKPGDPLIPVRESLDEEECDWAKLKLHLIQVCRE